MSGQWVSWLKQKGRESFYGCGECGSFWNQKKSLFRDITVAVKRYRYRASSYRKRGDEWLPGDIDKEVKNYEGKVENELHRPQFCARLHRPPSSGFARPGN